jgi:SAM-dependent methyltransferase
VNSYREQVWHLIRGLAVKHGPFHRVLDYGSGDGWFASQFNGSGLVQKLIPLDIKRRQKVFVEPQLFSGNLLPFDDAEFDLVYSIDVLHHCPDPMAQLRELERCSSRFLLIKDHNFDTWVGRHALAVLDELGNRRFGIPSPHCYQRKWEWHAHLVASGWQSISFLHPAPCHSGALGAMTNSLQYVALYERR